MLIRPSPLSGASIDYLEGLYRLFRSDPDRLDETWRCVFHVLDAVGDATGTDVARDLSARAGAGDGDATLVEFLRSRGHLFAALDPLGRNAAAGPDGFAGALPPPAAVDDVAPRYLGAVTLETAHIDDAGLRTWLIAAWEDRAPVAPANRRDVLHDLIRADEFERFMARKFAGKKRFGAEGAEAVVPLLRAVLRRAAAAGVTRVVIGTMHRGRLNLCATVLGRPLTQMLAEMKGVHPFPADPARPGDVPYHLGHVGRVETGAGVLDVTLLANPSHLEAVDPVVLGHARAQQDSLPPGSAGRVLPLILHTDAAVVGQGVVAEALQLAAVPGFSTGGTIHLVVNNQIGFTTEPVEARTSTHCTGPWKAVDSCILHVNGHDDGGLVEAAALAVDWRQTHARDAVIDLVCYRRNGHNEIDEPTFTQPLLYARIAAQEPVVAAATRRLVTEGVVTDAEVCAFADACRADLETAYAASASFRSNASGYRDQGLMRRPAATPTGVPPDRIDAVCKVLTRVPEAMALHPRMDRILRQREMGDRIAWPLAEALAFGTLLEDGVNVRLTGQDVVRGAFSHRHFDLVDAASGASHNALATLGGSRARFAVHNSPLSEYAVLGFEYGYSLDRPNDLTIWEAQFGDFANGAQVVVDQFIAAGEEKWCSPSGLVVLLPHGLEGQGPEHSSARVERFLQMAAGGNMRIANPSTPANYFHVLRRQALVADRKPLILMATKRLLRLPAAISRPAAFGPDKRFEPVVVHASGPSVERVLLCSGKIAYDLLAERERRGDDGVAVVALEELYPLPAEALRDLFAGWADAACLWVQEEPRNMGAWSHLDRRIEQLREDAGARVPRLAYVGRAEAGSPAGSFHGDHDAEQARLVADAFERAV